MKEVLYGERVKLKKHNLDQAEQMFKAVDSDRERLREFLPWVDLTKTLEDEHNYIKHTHKSWIEETLFDYGIFNEDGEYLGNCGIHTIDWKNKCCEIGYWILGSFEGRGYMSEAVTTLEKEIFANDFHRIEIRCSSKNLKSANVPKRLGYLHDGTLRQNAIEHGEFRDTFIFSKIKTD